MKTLTKVRKLFILVFLMCPVLLFSQTYIVLSVDQPEALVADAGPDITVNEGDALQLGGTPSADGGNGGYLYNWSPSDGLDDASAANPEIVAEVGNTYTLIVTDENECSASDDITISVTSVGSNTAMNLAQADFTIYPNPAGKRISLRIETPVDPFTLEFIDATGTIIFMEKFHYQKEIVLPQELSSLSEGMYFIILRNASFTITRKLIIQ